MPAFGAKLLVILAATLLLAGNLHAQPTGMMHGGDSSWALVAGGMMVAGAVVLASSPDEEGRRGTNAVPVMMGLMGTGMLIYYLVADDGPRVAQAAGSNDHQPWYQSVSVGMGRDTLLAVGTWRW